ncbi:MAG: TlpA family protein disulfide reductase [Butyricimonas faecihominis]
MRQISSKGFNIVSISIDSKRENWLTALKEENLSWGQLLDRRTPGESAFKAYNLTSVPSSILVDAQEIFAINARGG